MTKHLLDQVGIPRVDKIIDEYSFQLSGGMRQRAMIALAIACNPSLLLADEPTTAIDVTVQAKVLTLLKDLQSETGMSIVMITHDLGVIAEVSDVVAVMYLGKIVELGAVTAIFDKPLHPYTTALMRSIPDVEKKEEEELAVIRGSVPDPYTIIPGCRFSPRCDNYMHGTCNTTEPELAEVEANHLASCFLNSPVKKEGESGGE